MKQEFVLASPISESRTPSTTQETFFQFIWKNKINRRYLLIAAVGTIVQFVIFKMLYPFPDFFSDSYSYLYAAYANLNVSIWPIGYSKFLRLFHSITYSDTALIAFQYFLLTGSALYFFFSFLFLLQPHRIAAKITFIFLFINPLFLYLSNYVNSDCLFAAVSLIWITQLIYIIIQRPTLLRLFIQGILLFICFTIRNNAYYYPIVAIAAIFISRQSPWLKLVGIFIPFSLIVPFIIFTRHEALKITGTKQFSLFTGWQLANNALYIYDKIRVDSNLLPTPASKELNRMAQTFLSGVDTVGYRNYINSYPGNAFIRESFSPLKQYYDRHHGIYHSYLEYVSNWGKSSAAFTPFGKYIITTFPISYIRYFVLPNTWHYFIPPLLHFELYNYGQDKIQNIAKKWFKYPNTTVTCISYNLQKLLVIYSALFLFANVYFMWELMTYAINSKLKKQKYRNIITLITCFFLCNFLFSITATQNILRYQIIPLIILISFSLLLNPSSVIIHERETSIVPA